MPLKPDTAALVEQVRLAIFRTRPARGLRREHDEFEARQIAALSTFATLVERLEAAESTVEEYTTTYRELWRR